MSYNILIVDDSSVIRSMISRTIDMAGVPTGTVFQAANGKDALSILENNWMDLVLADLNMPEMDGATMIEKMLEDDVLRRIPVVVVSTEGSETKKKSLLEKGVKGFIHKPFTPEQVRCIISDVMGDWETEESHVPAGTF
jgi:two-component system, chemotaxis family, chemotaxis protein CheY